MKVGIEAIAFDVPEHYIDITDLAKARGQDPTKYTVGLGQKQMAIATPCEDTVVLAASAALRMCENFKCKLSEIGLLIVGTETGVDQSKPIASYIHQILGLPSNCRTFEVKHACYGAMAGLQMAINQVLSGRTNGRKALVIATDIARYGLLTPGEPTQGAGAVAMLISDQPTLFQLDTRAEGYFSKQVMDFWRPVYSKEAIADGHFSIQCYLDALHGSYTSYKSDRLPSNEMSDYNRLFNQSFAACLYHAPFVKMAQKAHQKLLEIDSGRSFEKDSPEIKEAKLDFDKRTAPYLELNSRIGNAYTGSLFLSLYNLLEVGGQELAGKEISIFSYGSGCCSEFMTGYIMPNAAQIADKFSFKDLLNKRKKIDIQTYESILEDCTNMDLNNITICDKSKYGLNREISFAGVREHMRRYQVSTELLPTNAESEAKTDSIRILKKASGS